MIQFKICTTNRMLVSRGALLTRVIANGLRSKAARLNTPSQQIARQAHLWVFHCIIFILIFCLLENLWIFSWAYRTSCAKHPKSVTIAAELVGAFMWWWVLWHLYHEYQHITVSRIFILDFLGILILLDLVGLCLYSFPLILNSCPFFKWIQVLRILIRRPGGFKLWIYPLNNIH